VKNLSFCILGNPVKHSMSPEIHTGFAKQFNLGISYVKIEPAYDQFEDAVRAFQKNGGHGANITAPFKERAFLMCDETTSRAHIAKSVNTFLFQSGKIIGDNTDGIGLLRDIKHHLQFSLTDKKILLLGAGGATRGILQPLIDENPAEILIANRSTKKAEALVNEFLTLQKKPCLLSANKTHLLNTTPIDVMIDCLPCDADTDIIQNIQFTPNSLFYDLKYHVKMRENTATIKANGLGMLMEQAAAAFYFWTGHYPNTSLHNPPHHI
jgi:shikimate dehydrogenase